MSKTRAWIFLMIAIVAEVIATISLKVSSGDLWGYILMGIFIIFSYYMMGLSVKIIPISIAYAMWEVLGLILICSFGIVVFGEILTFYQKLGLGFGIIGIILINLGKK
ncbi:SMR family transporter [Helicobacter sp. 11S03491-1]|uniref:DMT family transporter n=1 Tax=Helicobacter sp. 11S03491-1 TaxID=1476196 RepID=UPI000BA50BB7|nr:SMR family transporter [Helicobacter sp. 11S03491-1]